MAPIKVETPAGFSRLPATADPAGADRNGAKTFLVLIE
jgi:hypothetical protein